MGEQASERERAAAERLMEDWTRRDLLRRVGGLGLLALGASALQLAGCTVAPTSPAATSQATPGVVKGGNLITGTNTVDPATLNPLYVQSIADRRSSTLLFAYLVDYAADGTLVPALLKTVPKVADDKVSYRLELRDATWSDGKPITADDLIFTFDLVTGSKYDIKSIGSTYTPQTSRYIESVRAIDDKTVVLKTTVPYAPTVSIPGLLPPPLPKHVLEPFVADAKAFKSIEFNRAPSVVSGPFVFGKHEKGQQLTLNANPKYYAGRPNIDSFISRYAADDNALVSMLRTGEIDFAAVPPTLWGQLASATNVDRVSFSALSYIWYGYLMDPDNPKKRASGRIFGDPVSGKQVRQAMLHAVDRQTLASKVFFDLAEVATNVEPKSSWAYTDKVKGYAYDRAKAAAMLDAAGWKQGTDGIRTKDGARLSIEVICVTGLGPFESAGQVLIEAWKQVGIEAVLRPIQLNEFFSRWNSGDFDVLLISSNLRPDPDRSGLFDSRTIPTGGDPMRYKNTELNELFDQSLQAVDQAKRKEILDRIQGTLMEDLPQAPLVWPKTLYGVSKRVRGMNLGPFTEFFSYWVKDVWVTDGK